MRAIMLGCAAAVEAVPIALAIGLAVVWSSGSNVTVLSLPIAGAAAVAGFVVTRLVMRRHSGERAGRVAITAAALAAQAPLLLATGVVTLGVRGPVVGPVALVALAGLLYAWSRGTALARDDLQFDAVYGSFRRALVAVIAIIVLAILSAGTASQAAPAHWLLDAAWGDVVVLFVAGLCALSLARVEEERHRGAGPDGPPPLRGAWMMTLACATALVGAGGVALATLLSPRTLAEALAPLGHVADFLAWLLTPLIFALAVLADALLGLLRPLIHRAQRLPPQKPGAPPRQAPPPLVHLTPAQAVAIAHTVGIVAALVAACIALWLAFFYRQRSTMRDDAEEERTSLWSWALLMAGLRSALRRLASRLRGRRPRIAAAHLDAAPDPALLSVRAVYRALLARVAALGLPRRPDETPHELLMRLRSVLASGERDAALLTGLYARARYGPIRADGDDSAVARDIWSRLEPALRSPDDSGVGPDPSNPAS